MSMDSIRKFVIYIILFVFALFLPGTVHACSPAGPDPWYQIKVEFDKATLPIGVEILPVNGSYLPLRLINTSSTPLYIVNNKDPKSYSTDAYAKYSELPYGVIPIYKIVNNESYYFEPNPDEFPEPAKWRKNTIKRYDSSPNELIISESVLNLSGTGIENVYQDNRPSNTPPVRTDRFSMPIYYGNSPLQLTGTVTYALNPNYDPQKLAKGIKFCQDFMNSPINKYNPIIFIVGLILGISLLILIVYKKIR